MPDLGEEKDIAEQHGEEAHAVGDGGRVGDRKRPSPKQPQIDDGLGMTSTTTDEGDAGEDRNHDGGNHAPVRPTPVRTFRDGQHEPGERQADQHHAGVVRCTRRGGRPAAPTYGLPARPGPPPGD